MSPNDWLSDRWRPGLKEFPKCTPLAMDHVNLKAERFSGTFPDIQLRDTPMDFFMTAVAESMIPDSTLRKANALTDWQCLAAV